MPAALHVRFWVRLFKFPASDEPLPQVCREHFDPVLIPRSGADDDFRAAEADVPGRRVKPKPTKAGSLT